MLPDLLDLLPHPAPATLVAWLVCLVAVNPLVTLVHELGHAAVALRLTDDHVLVRMSGRRLRHVCLGRLHIDLALPGGGGVCLSSELPGRYGLAKAAIAGPVASLATGLAAVAAWRATGWIPLGAFALRSLVAAVFNGTPSRVAQDGRWQVSDGMWVARAFGLVRPPKPVPDRSAPIVGMPARVMLVLVGLLVAVTAPQMLLVLVPMFAYAWWSDVQDRERAIARAVPQPEEPWDTAGSKPPPGAR